MHVVETMGDWHFLVSKYFPHPLMTKVCSLKMALEQKNH
jgi:hypothetical protein